MTETKNENDSTFDTLELLTVILLGLAAIATAFASYESTLYSGRSVEAYSRSNKIATEAAAERSRAVVEMARDSSVDIDAMRLTLEADDAPTPAAEQRNYFIATYLYTRQMSDAGYKALGLPAEARKAAGQAADDPAAEQSSTGMQEAVLEKAMEKDLADDQDYRKEMLAKSQSQFDEAESSFKEGQSANQIGDKFQLVAVIYAISLFFGGIVQVSRSEKMRKLLLGGGWAIFVISTIYMLTFPLIFS